MTDNWALGGAGAEELGQAVVAACDKPKDFQLLYPDDMPLREKIETIATQVYGADGVTFQAGVLGKLKRFTEMGYGDFPICMAKTHLSLSHDPKLKGVPTGFKLPIRDVRVAAGAGFVYPLCGDMMTMPGLPSKPAFENVDIDVETGRVRGLF